MKIVYTKGDVTAAAEPVIIHGCNAQGVMGSGVAAAIRRHFPLAYLDYINVHEADQLHLGTIVWSRCAPKLIGNMITQNLYGRSGGRYVSYDAIVDGFEALNLEMHVRRHTEVAMPRIGAGLGGGNWRIIEAIIEETATHYQPVVYDYEG